MPPVSWSRPNASANASVARQDRVAMIMQPVYAASIGEPLGMKKQKP
jgi:hypothetical protein